MKITANSCVIAMLLLAGCRTEVEPLPAPKNKNPPFSGTIWIDPNIITSADPTSFKSLSYTGRGFRTMYDRRVKQGIYVEAFLFLAQYDDGLTIEIQVHPEFQNEQQAKVQADKYAPLMGQLPTALRKSVFSLWIIPGVEPFGGAYQAVLIHTGQSKLYEDFGNLEETLVHEAAHTSLDHLHASAPGWLASQAADGNFISTYARDFPMREDIAESFVLYIAIRYKSHRISKSLANTILETMPNRIKYFDAQNLNMHPLK